MPVGFCEDWGVMLKEQGAGRSRLRQRRVVVRGQRVEGVEGTAKPNGGERSTSGLPGESDRVFATAPELAKNTAALI